MANTEKCTVSCEHGSEGTDKKTSEQTQEQSQAQFSMFIQKFMNETYSFVTQQHLELTALTTILLEKKLLTIEELNASFAKTKANHDELIRRAKEAKVAAQRETKPPEGGIDIGSKPTLKHDGARKAPTGHGG